MQLKFDFLKKKVSNIKAKLMKNNLIASDAQFKKPVFDEISAQFSETTCLNRTSWICGNKKLQLLLAPILEMDLKFSRKFWTAE